eukprot:13452133-Alexandrium_andersonii.AAC.1
MKASKKLCREWQGGLSAAALADVGIPAAKVKVFATHAFMKVWLESCDALPSEEALDAAKVTWQSMFDCVAALKSSLKTTGNELKRHIKLVASASERKAKKQQLVEDQAA